MNFESSCGESSPVPYPTTAPAPPTSTPPSPCPGRVTTPPATTWVGVSSRHPASVAATTDPVGPRGFPPSASRACDQPGSGSTANRDPDPSGRQVLPPKGRGRGPAVGLFTVLILCANPPPTAPPCAARAGFLHICEAELQWRSPNSHTLLLTEREAELRLEALRAYVLIETLTLARSLHPRDVDVLVDLPADADPLDESPWICLVRLLVAAGTPVGSALQRVPAEIYREVGPVIDRAAEEGAFLARYGPSLMPADTHRAR